ncbi:hypothetical protein NP493_402g02026 [Ridgeia piscesae]|uniref:Uncharacterized protein n=1 Tax=Ridgeia piscesae TaxID=27915 RepID=A0AAD9IZP4_RIDPI|nr:hypothetical protein NP493_4496g00005 [Ridgeia piscesae]KAK2143572.1 hypothetical protein NP493_4496g00004 [Ridgeia piscesae]KAK2181292.1 hypothetical protein NP493_402g02026 [Ridgeia piscesae]
MIVSACGDRLPLTSVDSAGHETRPAVFPGRACLTQACNSCLPWTDRVVTLAAVGDCLLLSSQPRSLSRISWPADRIGIVCLIWSLGVVTGHSEHRKILHL